MRPAACGNTGPTLIFNQCPLDQQMLARRHLGSAAREIALQEYYARHAPHLNAAETLSRYRGREDELFERLASKYCETFRDPTTPSGMLKGTVLSNFFRAAGKNHAVSKDRTNPASSGDRTVSLEKNVDTTARFAEQQTRRASLATGDFDMLFHLSSGVDQGRHTDVDQSDWSVLAVLKATASGSKTFDYNSDCTPETWKEKGI